MGLVGILLRWVCLSGWLIAAGACSFGSCGGTYSCRRFSGAAAPHWTQTFMGSAAQFHRAILPVVPARRAIWQAHGRQRLGRRHRALHDRAMGARRAILAVVLAGALVTYGGVSLFVAFFVLAPMAQALFQAADIPRRLMPAAISLGTSTFTMTAFPGTPAIQNAIPMPFFGTTPFAAPGLGVIASAIMLGFGLWWLTRSEAAARRAGEGYGERRRDCLQLNCR